MTFTQAIKSGFSNYVNFTGRAARSEFWYWTLFAFLVGVAADLVDYVAGSGSGLIGELGVSRRFFLIWLSARAGFTIPIAQAFGSFFC
jgi:uncharacterized membrane protein YhaH (DUF805 family)